MPIVSIVSTAQEVATDSEAAPQKTSNRNNLRRGPNRRRPRNPDYKKPESDNADFVKVLHSENTD